MKLILAIISDTLITEIAKALTEANYKSTKLSSTGGFRKKGNTTLLIGVEEDRVDDCIELLRYTITDSNKRDPDENVADANIFVLPMYDLRRM